MQFGNHVPTREKRRSSQSPMAVFARGLQTPGIQWEFKFPNGYGASVINDGYGAEDGLYELAVLGRNDHLTYDTPITDDVLGRLTAEEVATALDQIAALTEESTAAARVAREHERRARRIADLRDELAQLEAEHREAADANAAHLALTDGYTAGGAR